MFQVLVFRVNVAEEANSNTRSGKSSHSSDDFPEFEAAAAAADRRCPLAPGALRRLAPVLLGGFSLIPGEKTSSFTLHSFLGWLSIIGPSNDHDSAERYLVLCIIYYLV